MGDMAAQWGEFAMLMRNDSVEGGSVNSLQEADPVYLLTKDHALRLQSIFGVFHPMHEMPAGGLAGGHFRINGAGVKTLGRRQFSVPGVGQRIHAAAG